ncbi:MAG: fibrinogen-like YCDxxxxGGGW domain-containing protein [Candidatus Absconditabacteria bacterium]
MAKSIKKLLKSFTLIELIIVIAIISVLGATAFLLLTQWMSKGRDAQRISDLSTIKTALDIAITKNDELPLPDENSVLLYSGTKILNQGKFGDQVVKSIGTLNKVPSDRLNGEYEYSLLYDKKTYRVRAEIENEIYTMSYLNQIKANNTFYRYIGKDLKALVVKDIFIYIPSMFITGYVNNEFDLYSSGFNVFVGEKVGEFKSGFALPANEIDNIKDELGTLGLQEAEINNIIKQGIGNVSTSIEIVVNGEGNTNDGFSFFGNGVQVYPKSCNDLIVSDIYDFKVSGPWNGSKFLDGLYWIKPDMDTAFKVYCDMSTDGGGWTKIMKANKSNSLSIQDETGNVLTGTYGKLSDSQINSLQGTYMRLDYTNTINYRIKFVFPSSNFNVMQTRYVANGTEIVCNNGDKKISNGASRGNFSIMYISGPSGYWIDFSSSKLILDNVVTQDIFCGLGSLSYEIPFTLFVK